MLKKYQAKSQISISVLLKKGTSVHISFSALTGGGSVYYTDDEDIQSALEKHLKFGKLFKCVTNTIEEKKTVAKSEKTAPKKVEDKDESAKIFGNDEIPTASEPADKNGIDSDKEADNVVTDGMDVTKIAVACTDDAREYLAGKFGISRSKMRSTVAIKEIAKANNIEFSGI